MHVGRQVPRAGAPRRRATRAVVAMAALGLLLAACGGDGAADGDPLVVGQVAEPASLDPHAVTAVNDFRITVNLYDGLVRYDSDSLGVEPALATDWTISDDGLTYTFTLREGVEFHDGTTFDADAVKFNFDRVLDENHPYHGTGPFPLANQFFGGITEVRVVDANTVAFDLGAPSAAFLSNLAYPVGLMVSPTAVQESGAEFGRNPVGTGPFRFVEWVSNERVTVEANPDYWGGAPGLPGVVFRPIVEAQTRVAELRSGGVDLIVEVPPDDVAALGGEGGITVATEAGPHTWFLILNALEPPLDDVRMRQALNYAINKESLVEDVLQGTATVAAGPVARAFGWAAAPDLEPYPYDPERAKALMAEAGYADGAELTFYVTQGGSGMLDPVPMGEAIQADLAAVGFDVTIQTFEWNAFLNEVNAGIEGKANMAEMAWMTDEPGTLPFLTLRTSMWPEEGGFNSGYYSNPRVDELLEQAAVETDQDVRAELFHEMQRIVVEDAPWVFVANASQIVAYSDAVAGFSLHPSFTQLRLGNATKGS